MKIYTRTGDKGKTGLIGGSRVSKSDGRISTYGQIDELNANVGFAISSLNNEAVKDLFTDIIGVLSSIQADLFILGSDLADPSYPPSAQSKTPRVTQNMIVDIEKNIDKFETEVQPISFFILPGGTLESSILHICRSVARRAEVSLVTVATTQSINEKILAYLNRLSDLLFVIARVCNKRQNFNDVAWTSKSN
ncbi:MAG TPA: cob(I)yrinic acid a,c-diamide adenosyltransferase [Nitrososphaeraceae archaeon]|jgi:cob(I)alamin adenosyltransferase